MENKYDVIVSTPLGEMDGVVTMNVEGKTFSGSAEFMGQTCAFNNGQIDENGNFFTGTEVKVPFGKVSCIVAGTLKDGKVDAKATCKMGEFAIKSK